LTVDVEAGGRRHAIDVRRLGDCWLVTIDGRQVTASVMDIGGRWSLLLGPPEGGSYVNESVGAGFSRPDTWRSYEVSIEPGTLGEVIVRVDGYAVRVTMPDAGAATRQRFGRRAVEASGPAAVVAPMPGRIVKVLVEPGDVVEPRQGLVVIEAMKMENELRAPQPGTVTEVRVQAGMSVDAHAVLVVIG
jgi:biotin carboxyl carrier protein